MGKEPSYSEVNAKTSRSRSFNEHLSTETPYALFVRNRQDWDLGCSLLSIRGPYVSTCPRQSQFIPITLESCWFHFHSQKYFSLDSKLYGPALCH